ncbi:MAG: putative rane protein, partial [Verrucomicrobiaceae bacterium]|nr:putative rane protein [Verrucomicrobiaceae bacterium]
LGVAGLVLGHEALTGQLQEQIKGYVGPQAGSAIQTMIESASRPSHGWLATVIGFVALMFGAAGVFGELKDALNTIWGVKPKPGVGIMSFIGEKFLNFGMVLVIGFLLLVSLVLTAFVSGLSDRFSHIMEMPPFVWGALTSLISFGMVTTLFALIFKVLPDLHIRWRDVWVGAALTGVLFEIGKAGLGWYLGRESTAGAYGAASSVVLLLLWVYYASCIMFFGAEFTQAHAEANGLVINPTPEAQKVTADDRAEQGLKPHPEREQRPGAVEHPPFSHRLVAPLLKYLGARGVLVSLEAREALNQIISVLLLAAIGIVAIFAGWLLLATALVGVLTAFMGLFWVKAVAIAGGAHMLVAGILAFIIWTRLRKASWFADTFNELRKDRAWLQGSATKL